MVVKMILLAAAVTAVPAALACTPNYQVSYEACKLTGQITGISNMKVENVPVNRGACDPDPANLCRSYNKSEFAQKYPGVNPANIVATEWHTEVAEGKFCGDFPKIHNKVDVYCTFEFQAPQFSTVSDPSCPVAGASDAVGCYSQKPIVVDTATVNGCLDSQPETDSDWWIKSMCLADVYKASRIFSTKGLSTELVSSVTYQLNIIDNYTSSAASRPSLLKLNQTLRNLERP